MANSHQEWIKKEMIPGECEVLGYFIQAQVPSSGEVKEKKDLSEPAEIKLIVISRTQQAVKGKLEDTRLPILVGPKDDERNAPVFVTIGVVFGKNKEGENGKGSNLPQKLMSATIFFDVLWRMKEYQEKEKVELKNDSPRLMDRTSPIPEDALNKAIAELTKETSHYFCYNRALKNEKLAALMHLQNEINREVPNNQKAMDDILVATILFWRAKNDGQDVIFKGSWAGKKSWFGRNDFSSRTKNAFEELAGGKQAFEALMQKISKHQFAPKVQI